VRGRYRMRKHRPQPCSAALDSGRKLVRLVHDDRFCD
jgi:hypothetical protein